MTGNRRYRPGALQHQHKANSLFCPTRTHFFLHREHMTTCTRVSGLVRRAAALRPAGMALRKGVRALSREPGWGTRARGHFGAPLRRPGNPPCLRRGRCRTGRACALGVRRGGGGRRKRAEVLGVTRRGRAAVAAVGAVAAGVSSAAGGSD